MDEAIKGHCRDYRACKNWETLESIASELKMTTLGCFRFYLSLLRSPILLHG